jgi:transposase
MIATIKPRDIVGKTRRRLAVVLTGELETIGKKIKAAEKDLESTSSPAAPLPAVS